VVVVPAVEELGVSVVIKEPSARRRWSMVVLRWSKAGISEAGEYLDKSRTRPLAVKRVVFTPLSAS
jgi:hypothetical protein